MIGWLRATWRRCPWCRCRGLKWAAPYCDRRCSESARSWDKARREVMAGYEATSKQWREYVGGAA